MFTSCVIIASAILFREFASVTVKDWVGLFCGASAVLVAILLLHCCKDFDISLMMVAQQIHIMNPTDNCSELVEDEDDHQDELQETNTNEKLLSPLALSRRGNFSYGTNRNT
jgi:hypothetical protein